MVMDGLTYLDIDPAADLDRRLAAAQMVFGLSPGQTALAAAGSPIPASAPPTMLFSRGKLSVFGGVNQISGSYALVHDAVVMGDLVSTRKAGPPELMDLEGRFITALAGVNGFTVAGDDLTLLTDGKAVAEFRSSN